MSFSYILFFEHCFSGRGDISGALAFLSSTSFAYQIHTFNVDSMEKCHIWCGKEVGFNILNFQCKPSQFDWIIHFAAWSDDDVIHGALLVERDELQYVCTWTYDNGDFKLDPLQLIRHNKRYTRIARCQSLLAVCTETQKKATSFVDVLIWRVGQESFRCQTISVGSKVIDFIGHSAYSFCVATETEIVLVDEENIKIKEYRGRAIAVRYNPHTKKWKRFLRTSFTYNYNGKEQQKDYVIDPYGENWIIITDEGPKMLDWYREGERQSKRSNVSGGSTLCGFFQGGKVIIHDEHGDPMIRGYTLTDDEWCDKMECDDDDDDDEEEEEEEDVDFNLFDEESQRHGWEIQAPHHFFSIHSVGDKLFLVTPLSLSILEDEEERSLLGEKC